jgi:hypothetical protein
MQHLWNSLLRTEIKGIIPSGPRLRAPACVLTTAILIVLVTGAVFAGSATWNLNPTSGDWNTATNWMPATVPHGPNDTATFDVSNVTDVSLSANTEVAAIVFNPGANAFTITVSPSGSSTFLTIEGAGITNNSVMIQNFVAARREAAEISARKKSIIGILSNVAELGAARMEETIGKAGLRDAAIGTGIAVDKMLALAGQMPAVQIANVIMPSEADREQRRQLHDKLDAIAQRLSDAQNPSE